MNNLGTLYIVATPIGNLEDITLRAIHVLKDANTIYCEDTRTTKKLLDRYEIQTPVASFSTHASKKKFDTIIDGIREGKSYALVSDAGTPCISDPGSLLVKKVYEEFERDACVVPIPGPSALIAAYSASGITGGQFLFLGYLPHKKGRETIFKEMATSTTPVIVYESPHRIMKTLESLEKILPTEKMITIGRELTKIHEETIKGSAQEVLHYFKENQDHVRGEFVLIVS
jgi:16S rRNA (cytidine1402-2'-O)-methyltransferase